MANRLESSPKQSTMSILSEWLQRLNNFQCAVLGEYIEDEYVTIIPRGTTQGLRTYEETEHEIWEGGAVFIGHHLQALGATVEIEGRGGARKTRYVTPDGHRLFSVAQRRTVKLPLSREVPSQRCIICADYGHGAFDQDYIDLLCAADRFIALTVQANSLNCKGNLLTKWPRADYVLINQEELLLCNDAHLLIPALIKQLADKLHTQLFVVTRGAKGLWAYSDGMLREQKSLNENVIDSMGAGDTFLAVTTPLVIMGAPIETILQIGSVAAGLHCGKRGNPTLIKGELLDKAKELLQ